VSDTNKELKKAEIAKSPILLYRGSAKKAENKLKIKTKKSRTLRPLC